MPKIYIPNKSSHDFSPASCFGTFVYMTDRQVNRFATTNLYRHFTRILRGSSPDDYILLTSLTVINVIAATLFAKKHGRLNILIYNAKRKCYVERTIIL